MSCFKLLYFIPGGLTRKPRGVDVVAILDVVSGREEHPGDLAGNVGTAAVFGEVVGFCSGHHGNKR